MQIERLGPDDWATFREVRLASLSDSPAAFGSRHEDWVDAPEQQWRARLTDVPLTLVAREDGALVGVASGVPDGPDRAELISMWVAPQSRGRGVAAALVGEVVQWARAQGRRTRLMVRADNLGARAAYERLGFLDLGVPEGWPEDEPVEHLMELRD